MLVIFTFDVSKLSPCRVNFRNALRGSLSRRKTPFALSRILFGELSSGLVGSPVSRRLAVVSVGALCREQSAKKDLEARSRATIKMLTVSQGSQQDHSRANLPHRL